MRIKLVHSSVYSTDMEKHCQKLIEAGWKVVKETRTIKGFTPSWDIVETAHYIDMALSKIFDLSDVLGQELVLYKEDGQPVIEIYDDWRE